VEHSAVPDAARALLDGFPDEPGPAVAALGQHQEGGSQSATAASDASVCALPDEAADAKSETFPDAAAEKLADPAPDAPEQALVQPEMPIQPAAEPYIPDAGQSAA
jgi:hypothetical protein